MKVVVAPDKLRGTYTAENAAAALARGWQDVRRGDDLVQVPLADGGEGTAAALLRHVAASGGRRTSMTRSAGRARPASPA